MQLTLTLAALFVACRPPATHPPVPGSIPDGSAPPTGDTGPSPGLPGFPVPTGRPLPQVVLGPLTPSVRIDGMPNLSIDIEMGAVPAFGDDPSVLYLNGNDEAPMFAGLGLLDSLAIPGALPNGTYNILDVWDGVSGYTDGVADGFTHVAGDVNDDGHLDMWFGDELQLGPFLGRTVRYRDDAVARVDDDGYAAAAGFDADRDGNEDVLFVPCCQTGIVRYGPFSGLLPSAWNGRADPATVSWLGDGSGCSVSTEGAVVLADQLGPGHPAVAIGVDWAGDCYVDTIVYDLGVPPGSRAAFPGGQLAFADDNAEGMVFDDLGDVDADGHPDVLYGNGVLSMVLAGPLAGFVTEVPLALGQSTADGKIEHGIGDINGDGVQELLQSWERSWDPEREPYAFDRSWVILFSPHADPVIPWVGLDLGIVETLDSHLGGDHLDLDGDGLADLIGRQRNTPLDVDDAGAVLIWYGRDLLDAWLTRGPPDPPDTP